jgi:uncharacterized repeat protein (TIGR01451 family)
MCDLTVARRNPVPVAASLVLACILFGITLAQAPAVLAQGPGESSALVPAASPAQMAPQSVIIWTSPTSGLWDNAANWSGGIVPGPGDHAVISPTATSELTVTVPFSTTGTTVGSLVCTRRLEVASSAQFTVTSVSLISGTSSATGLTLNGALNAPGGLTVGGFSQVNSGGSIAGVVTNTGRMSLDGIMFLKGTLNNAGYLDHNSGNLELRGSPGITATLNNLVSAIYESKADTRIQLGSGSCGLNCPQAVNNWGTLLKSGGGGISYLVLAGGSSVVNDTGGVMEAITGTLHVGAPGLRTGTTFNASSGAVVLLAGPGDADYAGTISGSGLGEVRFQGALFLFHDASLNFSPGLLHWSAHISGTVTNVGSLTYLGGALVGTLNNDGVLVHEGTNPLSLGSNAAVTTTLNNRAGGLYDFQGDGRLSGFCVGCAPRVFNNWGVLRKSGGTGVSGIMEFPAFQNDGAIEALSGKLQIDKGFMSTGTVTVASGAELQVDGVLTLQGGSLAGSGTVIGHVANSGVVSPGGSPGLLTIMGNYNQSPTGALRMEIGGLTPGAQFDQLATGYATLDGSLEVTLTNGFMPNWGDVFPILGYVAGRSGTFDTVSAPFVSATVAYGSEWVYLMAGQVAGQVADLAVTVTDDRTATLPGLSGTYTATLHNDGPADVTGAVYTATLPAGWDTSLPATGQAPAAFPSGLRPLVWYAGVVNLAAGETVTYSWSGFYGLGVNGTHTMTVELAPPPGIYDPNLANNTAIDVDVTLPPIFLPLVTRGS